MGHSRSLAMSPFDRVHPTFYSSSIETKRISLTVFKTQQAICLCIRMFSHVNTIPACDGQTDRQTHRQTDDDS